MQQRRILIVDDDGVLRETLADQLAVDGEFVAIPAGSIGEAEAKLASKDARLIGDARTNSLIVTDLSSNIRRMINIVDAHHLWTAVGVYPKRAHQ